MPVGVNSLLLVGLGIAFHRLTRRRYPHVAAVQPANTHGTADPPAPLRVGFRDADVDAALARLGETFDIDRGDLERVLREIEQQAAIRARGDLACADVMSCDVVSVAPTASQAEARALLIRHNVRLLPVIGTDGRLAGTVGLRELAAAQARGDADAPLATVISPARTTAAAVPAVALVPVLTDGRTHAVIVTDAGGRVEGLISQTDLLAALGRLPAVEAPAPRLRRAG